MAKNNQNSNEKKEFFNFGAGWDSDEYDAISCSADWKQNQKKNKGQGYKLFAMPVDATGEQNGEAVEIKYFRFKRTEKDAKAPEGAPDYSFYTWVQ
jgi:hypothetical protein